MREFSHRPFERQGCLTVHIIRAAQPADVEVLVMLCAEHAAFERAAYVVHGKAAKLSEALFGPNPSVRAWVAEVRNAVVGYATATEDFSTWSATRFLSMDCLFVRQDHRNSGVGASLLRAVVGHARENGVHEVQWQTPAWNTDARRFYTRQGAVAFEKARFCLSVA